MPDSNTGTRKVSKPKAKASRSRKPVPFGVVVRQIASANGEGVTETGKRIRRWIRANYDDAQKNVFVKNEKGHADGSTYGDVTPSGVKALKSRFVKSSK